MWTCMDTSSLDLPKIHPSNEKNVEPLFIVNFIFKTDTATCIYIKFGNTKVQNFIF